MHDENVKAAWVSNQVIELTYTLEDTTLNARQVSRGWDLAHKLDPANKSVVCVRTGRWTLLDKPAREYVISQFKKWPAVAVFVHNSGQRLMGNFVVQMVGQAGHVKIFNNEEKLQAWVKERLDSRRQ